MCEDGERYGFVVEWYDPAASLIRRYTLTFHDWDNSVEMYDPKNHRLFLRRAKAKNVRLSDLYIGNSVNILGRQLTFIAYADEATRKRLGAKNERTLALIMPDAMCHMGQILDTIWKSGLQITNLKTIYLSHEEAAEFYASLRTQSSFSKMVDYLISGAILALEIKGEGALKKWLDLIGPSDPVTARNCLPNTLRARFGTDIVRNAFHGPDSATAAHTELEFFFPSSGPKRQSTACFSDSTCGIIKPHIVSAGVAGEVIIKILECGFDISALLMVKLDKANSEEFLEVYKGVVPEYPMMVVELCSGPCIALEIRAQNASSVFREFVGPADPEIARHLRPRTLRAQYGKTKTQNALHCTDLPEDGLLEVEYFFKILDR